MKNMKRLIAMALVMMLFVAMFSVTSVSAAVTAGKGKLLVSHFNQSDVYANCAVLFTKEFMGNKTLQDITAEYKGQQSEKLNAVDAEWTSNYADHGFNQFYAMVCVWNEDNARYEVQSIGVTGGCPGLSCPDNGFIFAMHHDDDLEGRHNYPSQVFADQNYGDKTTVTLRPDWNSMLNQPVYLYNIDLEKLEAGSGIVTSGTFNSKMSPAGLDNGLVEIYENFSTESYIMVGEEDPNATVEYYEPKNITVSFSRIDKLVKDYEDLEQLDYNSTSWANLEAAINKYDEAGKAALDNKGVKAWAEEIEAAMDALVEYDGTEEEGGTGTQGTGVVNPGVNKDNKNNNGGNTTLIIVIAVVAVLVIAGVVFLVVAMKKGGKKDETSPAEEKAEETTEEPKE